MEAATAADTSAAAGHGPDPHGGLVGLVVCALFNIDQAAERGAAGRRPG